MTFIIEPYIEVYKKFTLDERIHETIRIQSFSKFMLNFQYIMYLEFLKLNFLKCPHCQNEDEITENDVICIHNSCDAILCCECFESFYYVITDTGQKKVTPGHRSFCSQNQIPSNERRYINRYNKRKKH